MKRYAAIDIGAHAMKLKIIEKTRQGKIKVLEDVIVPLSLGLSVLEKGKLDQRTISDMTEALLGFKRLLLDYDVKEYRAVATGVVREAQNGRFATAILSKRSNLNIEILEESVERFLTYIALQTQLHDYGVKRKEGMLVVEVGSSSSEVIIYKENKLLRNNEIHIGTLKLKAMMRDIERVSLYTPQIIEDHIYALTANLQSYVVRQQINHFVMIGSDIKKLKQVFEAGGETLSIPNFKNLVSMLYTRDESLKSKIQAAKLDYDEVLVAVIVFNQFLEHTTCEQIEVPTVALRDGLLLAMMEATLDFERTNLHTKDVLSAARYIAKRHHSTMPHVRQLERYAVKIFDAYKELEQFTERDLLLLRLAAILHETGKFSRQVNYHSATYQSITHVTLLGLTKSLLEDVAQIAMQAFAFSGEAVEEVLETSFDLKIKTIKLGLLLALADAMDKSKKQNLKLHEVTLHKENLTIICDVFQTSFLEEWAIRSLKTSFYDVFGHNLTIKMTEVNQ